MNQIDLDPKFSAAVQRIADRWSIDHAETVKRLAALAALEFDLRHHEPIERLATFVADGEFVTAAHQAAVVIDENSERELSQEGKFAALLLLVEHNEKQRGLTTAGES